MGIVEFLRSERARRLIDEFCEAGAFDPARDVPRLRRHLGPDEAAAVADMLAGRPLARAKFGDWADHMIYSLEGLRQATPRAVAEHRAARFRGLSTVADLGCGIGADAMAFDARIVALDIDRDRVEMALHNAGSIGRSIVGVRADLETLPPFGMAGGFADPARRDAGGGRIFDVERYLPPLSLILERWAPRFPVFAVKVHPGIAHEAVPAGAEAEFVSLDGDMKEACLWLGEPGLGGRTRATVLPSGASVTGMPLAERIEPGSVRSWIFEPDPAVIRAGLVGDVARALGLTGLDPTIAYLSGDAPVQSTLVRGYRVEEVMPFNAKRIRANLRRKGVGSVTVKKRGTVVDPEVFRRGLDLTGDAHRVVILTRIDGRPVAVICESE